MIATLATSAQDAPKREFRGAWMHIIGQGQYAKMTPSETQDYLRDQLNKLDSAGVNAIIFNRTNICIFEKRCSEINTCKVCTIVEHFRKGNSSFSVQATDIKRSE